MGTSYNVFLQEYSTEVQVNRGSGRVDRYLDTGGGTYAPPVGVNDELIKTSPSSFTLNVWAQNVTYAFSDAGGDGNYRLDMITDRNGKAVVMHYFDNTPLVVGGSVGGAPPAGYFSNPEGVDVDQAGNIYVVDSGYHRLQVFNNTGSALAVVGSYGSGNEQFNAPIGVTVDATNGVVYIADSGNNRIQKFHVLDTGLSFLASIGVGVLSNPRDVAVDEQGNIYVVDSYTRVMKYL